MNEKIAEAMVDEMMKIGIAPLVAAGLAVKGAQVAKKTGLLKSIIKHPTVRSAASTAGQAAAWTAPSLLMRPKPPKERPLPVKSGVG